MSEAKHTPGDWIHEKGAESVFALGEDGFNRMWMRMEVTVKSGTPKASDELQGNLDLIAAAPDIFSALRDARVYVEKAYECAFPDSIENEQVLAAIDAAIAKAEGKQ